jgi:hypothetical protein
METYAEDRSMRFWIVKGNPSRNDLDTMLVSGKVQDWVTRKPPRDWAKDDGIFFWKSAPALRLVGLGSIEALRGTDDDGQTWFGLRYLTAPLEVPLSIEELRADSVVGTASFLKAGAAGTVFPLTEAQADRLLRMVQKRNPATREFAWNDAKPKETQGQPLRALSIRQPWAELIMRGEKTIEVRSLRTNIRGRVHVYASLGDVHPESRARVVRQYGLDVDALPRGVLLGTVEIVDCRPLAVRDSRAAAFRVPEDTTDFAWLLAAPQRATQLLKPARHPQPVFFTPF